ncbi:major capsid protein [Suttonella ornithocola]|nr:major capsid protein [Suttonella ornithocola]
MNSLCLFLIGDKVMKKLLIVPALYAGYAAAALPPEVQQTIDSTKEDITTVGAAIVVLAVTAMGFRWLKAQFF